MDVDVTVVLAAVIVNEGGEYTLPISTYDQVVSLKGHGIAFEVIDPENVKLIIVKDESNESEIIVPEQG